MSQKHNIICNGFKEEDPTFSKGKDGSTKLCDVPNRSFKLTMEVPLFLIMLGSFMSSIVISNILLYKTCLHALNYPKSECVQFLDSGKKTNITSTLENEVQKYATVVRMVYSVIEAFVPAILSLFLGVWSDTYGRKPLVVWPLFGTWVSSILIMIYATLDSLGPWWFLVTVIPFSLSGGLAALITGAFCYVTDITTKEERSIRIATLEAVIFIGTLSGIISSPLLLRFTGIFNLLLLTSAIYFVAYIYTNIWIEESRKGAVKGTLGSVLNFTLVKVMIASCVKRRPNKGRIFIFLLIICSSLSILISYGVSDLEYMYTRNKLQWSLDTFSIYSTVYLLIMVVGMILGVTVLQEVLKVSDIHLAMVSYLSCISDYFIKTFALSAWHMYLAALVSLFRGLAGPLIRSLLSKTLPAEDLSKIFALMGVLNGITPLFAPIVFNSVYTATISVFPGAIYMLGGIIYISCFVMLCVVKFYMWKYLSTNPYTTLS